MSEDELTTLLRPYLDKKPEGIFDCGQFDLDVDLRTPGGLRLWLDGDTSVPIPSGVDSALVQRVVESLGHRLLHTWGQQYTERL